MGVRGELVRNVFYRKRSNKSHERNVRRSNVVVEKRKWNSIRSYLCGDEHNSVLVAEEDSASVKSSEATTVKEDITTEENKEEEQEQEEVGKSSLEFQMKCGEEEAAILIQYAFRSFLDRRRNEETELKGVKHEFTEGMKSLSKKSLSSSVEVQTGNSKEVFSVQGERTAAQQRLQPKSKTQLLKQKEEWDDSTVSSNISQMRIQNRVEATTRRERALAYAFSQQLRICSTKEKTKSDGMEANMGWSWLERWMATRISDSPSVESQTSKNLVSNTAYCNQRCSSIGRRQLFDLGGGEEKESCGSNEAVVPLQSDQNLTSNVPKETIEGLKPGRNGLKATKGSAASKGLSRELAKSSKRDCP